MTSRTRPLIRFAVSTALTAMSGSLALAPALAGAAPPAETKAEATAKPKASKAKAKNFGVELDIHTFALDNGLEVHVVEDHSTPAFTLYISYDVGSRDEVAGRTGFAHFFEHMMFQGSKNLPDNAIAENTSKAGGYVNAATSFDSTIYFHAIPSQYLDLVLWGEADRLSGLEITQETFEAQRAAVKSEKDRSENNPMFAMTEHLVQDLFAGTPYNHLPIGTLADLDAAEAKDTQAFFDTYYVPNNATMVIVGDVDLTEVESKVRKYFGPIPKGAEKPAPTKSEQQHGKKVDRELKDSRTKQTIFAFAWPTVGQDHPDRAALDLLGVILAGGRSARLPKILDDEKKLTVGTGGGHMLVMRDAGGMALITVPAGEKATADEIKKIVADEVAKIAKKGVSKRELDKAYNQQIMGVLNTLSTNAGRAGVIADGAMAYGDPKRVLTDLERYKAVTPKDVKRVAATYLTVDGLFYSLAPE